MAWIEPIYDRTQQDVDTLKDLATAIKTVGWSNASQAQREQWLSVSTGITKGALNAFDLNRIDGNIVFLRDWLESDYGIEVIIDEGNPVWDITLTPLLSNINAIRDNVNKLVNESYTYGNSPEIEYTTNPNWDDINDIEKTMYDLHVLLEKISLTWNNCGTFNCGQGSVIL